MEADYMNGPVSQRYGEISHHLQRPRHNEVLQRQHLSKMMDRMSDLDDGDSETNEIDNSSTIMNLNPANGQNIALWSFTKSNHIAIFYADNHMLETIVKYAQKHLGFLEFEHKLMFLSSGQLSPIDLKKESNIRPGCVVMVMPKYNVPITIEISQLKTSFQVTVDLTMTVFKIKSYIKKRKGIPIERQEILFSNKALENNKRLFEYRVKSVSTLYIMIQAHFDLLINVETFWGKTYRFYLDPCSTGLDIIYAVFNRAFSTDNPNDTGLHELYVPMHILVMEYQSKIVNWDYCIAYLGIHSGDTLTLTTVGHKSDIKMQNVNVITESGEKYNIKVSQFDRWSILAFMLHGLTNVPVDLIRLYKDGKRADFCSNVGKIDKHHVVLMNIVMTHLNNDLVFGVPLKISIGNGIVENIRMSAKRTVHHLKRKLEEMGVPNATLYELTISNQKLPNTSKIKDVVSDLKLPLALKLETYPVFAHAPDGVIYKTYLKVNETLGRFKHKIELKTGSSLKSSQIFMVGEELQAQPHSVLYESGVSCRNSLFIQYIHELEKFHILGNDWHEIVRIPLKPTSMDIKNAVWNAGKLSDGSLNCVLTILYWFLVPRIESQKRNQRKTKIKQRMPVAKEMLYEQKRHTKPNHHARELQDKPRAAFSSPYPGEEKAWTYRGPKVRHYIKNEKIPKFESDQIIDQNKNNEPIDLYKYNHRTMLPEIKHSPKISNTPWMKNLKKREKENRLLIAETEGGPNGMMSIHQSRLKKFEKKIDAKLSDGENAVYEPNEPHHVCKDRYNDPSHKGHRFNYDHHYFDFISMGSEDENDGKTELQNLKSFLPKL